MTQEKHNDGFDGAFKDDRSPLRRLLGEGGVPHRIFAFAGSGGRFKDAQWAVRDLDAGGREQADADAFAFLVGKGGWTDDRLFTSQGSAALDLEAAIQVLSRVLVDPVDPTRPFGSAADIRGSDKLRGLDENEVLYLFNQWLVFHNERSCFDKTKDTKEAEEIFVSLGKGFALPTSLLSYDTATLRNIVLSGARLYSTLTKQDSSD